MVSLCQCIGCVVGSDDDDDVVVASVVVIDDNVVDDDDNGGVFYMYHITSSFGTLLKSQTIKFIVKGTRAQSDAPN